MNDTERADLVDDFENELSQFLLPMATKAAAQTLHELLANRPVPEPAADADAVPGFQRITPKGLTAEQVVELDSMTDELRQRMEPAADAVERVAKAMFTLEKDASGALVQWDDLLDNYDNYGRSGVAGGKSVYRDLARAALQAAAVELEPGLDELLDSVHPECLVKAHGKKGDSEHVVIIWHPDIDGNYYPEGYEWVGYGSGFTEAVAAAVRQAKENGDG